MQIIYTRDYRTADEIRLWGTPVVHIHSIHRDVHGNGIFIRVYGEMKIAGQERIFARELKLNTLETLDLTTHHGGKAGYLPYKWIHNKGEFDNYASIHVWETANNSEMDPGEGPEDGSIWLDFIATGE